MAKFIVLFISLYAMTSGATFDKKFREREIKAFYAHPSKYYNSSLKHAGNKSFLSVDIKHKIKYREKIVRNELKTLEKSIILKNDRPSRLLRDIYIERNIHALEKLNIKKGYTKNIPWSDDYWPIYKGILGARYGDQHFEFLETWQESFDYIQAEPAFSLFRTGLSSVINKLSPSEKFDLLVGEDTHLSDQLWAQGKRYADNSSTGDVETWMGICHGWAPASYLVPRPQRAIEVIAFDGMTPIKFYPSDLKALASLLWASTQYPTNFIGGRCRLRDPERDQNGRVVSQDCADNNPATFFLSVLNGVGVHGKSFVMDITPSYEVWNQPIRSYEYSFFNPLTQKPVEGLQDGLINLAEYRDDPFRRKRARNAKYVLGVNMVVSYGVETSPVQREMEGTEEDRLGRMFLMFDLELDKNFNIIGGEWFNRSFPDFLWKPAEGANAQTHEDYFLLSKPLWKGKEKIDNDVAQLAQAAARDGKPLAYIVNSLIKLAR